LLRRAASAGNGVASGAPALLSFENMVPVSGSWVEACRGGSLFWRNIVNGS
jgi:hypothetical protein